ncbi:MAG: Hsp20/alpha crystallin family protein [Bacteroidales bacterium]|nr:Hsp20/alpha crystallin family protein [Bacteroidales bacterium]
MLVKRRGYLSPYSNYIDDFFGRDFFNKYLSEDTKCTLPTANIIENEKNFQVEIAIPGFKKENFSVEINQNILSIKGDCSKESEESKQKEIVRKEHYYSSFERQFTLPDTIKANDIEASYEQGMLVVTLPKKAEKELNDSKIIKIK